MSCSERERVEYNGMQLYLQNGVQSERDKGRIMPSSNIQVQNGTDKFSYSILLEYSRGVMAYPSAVLSLAT